MSKSQTKKTKDDTELSPGNAENRVDTDQKKLVNWKLVDLVAKLFVVGLILLLCWNVLRSTFFLGPTRHPPESRAQKNTKTETDSQTALTDFNNGSWSFGDGSWSLSVNPGSAEDGFLDVPTLQRSKHPDFDDQEFIDRLKVLGAEPKELGNGLVLWKTQPKNGFEMAMFTRDSVVQIARTKFPSPTGFTVIEGLPRPGLEEGKVQLMPIENGIKQVATRVDARDRVTSVILEIDSEYQGDVRVLWKDQGWDVRLIADVSGKSTELGAQRYRCSKGSQVVEATFFLNESSQKPNQIILNRIQFEDE